MEEIKFKHFSIRIHNDEFMQTVFIDPETGYERTVNAAPNYSEEDVARARSLGYDGTNEEAVKLMSSDHEKIHSWLAYCEGAPYSFTLHAAAHGVKLPLGWVKREENAVFCIQALMNATRKGKSVTEHIKETLKQND